MSLFRVRVRISVPFDRRKLSSKILPISSVIYFLL
jgi:hypothetical protein